MTRNGDAREVEVELFSDLEVLIAELEPPEVRDGAYTVFDDQGRSAVLMTDNRTWSVAVVRWDPPEVRKVDLKEAMVHVVGEHLEESGFFDLPTERQISRLTEYLPIR